MSKKESCIICGIEKGKFARSLTGAKTCDGYICSKCVEQMQPQYGWINFSSLTKHKAIEHIKKKQLDKEIFTNLTPTASVGKYFYVFGDKRLWACDVWQNNAIAPDLFSFDDIINYEYLEDGTTITRGGLGTAAVGGLLFGGVGAIVGGTWGKKQKGVINKISVRISTRLVDAPHIEIVLLNEESKKGGFLATNSKEKAMEILSLLDQITQSTISLPEDNPSFSVADEIMKFKNLLDSGIITQEEFEEKKKQLLGI